MKMQKERINAKSKNRIKEIKTVINLNLYEAHTETSTRRDTGQYETHYDIENDKTTQ